MTIKWPALKAALEPHTVPTKHGRMAGWLVRCTASRRELGFVWQAGSAWRWQTPEALNFGERSTQRGAVEVLRDTFDSRQQGSLFDAPRTPSVRDIQDAWTRPLTAPRPLQNRPPSAGSRGAGGAPFPRPLSPPAPKPKGLKPQPTMEAAPKRIVWGEQTGDVTAAIAAALRRQKGDE